MPSPKYLIVVCFHDRSPRFRHRCRSDPRPSLQGGHPAVGGSFSFLRRTRTSLCFPVRLPLLLLSALLLSSIEEPRTQVRRSLPQHVGNAPSSLSISALLSGETFTSHAPPGGSGSARTHTGRLRPDDTEFPPLTQLPPPLPLSFLGTNDEDAGSNALLPGIATRAPGLSTCCRRPSFPFFVSAAAAAVLAVRRLNPSRSRARTNATSPQNC